MKGLSLEEKLCLRLCFWFGGMQIFLFVIGILDVLLL